MRMLLNMQLLSVKLVGQADTLLLQSKGLQILTESRVRGLMTSPLLIHASYTHLADAGAAVPHTLLCYMLLWS